MTSLNPNFSRRARKRLMASAAALALVASGIVGGAVLAPSLPARAAAVSTTGLDAQAMPSFATLAERVKPAVVAIQVTMENAAAEPGDAAGRMDNLPPEMREFFRRFGAPGQDRGRGGEASPAPRPAMAQGSGFFISADGYVVTNNHVVERARQVTIVTDAGKSLNATVVGTDPKTDLALLKVSEPGDYPFVSFAREAPRVGDWVVAIGNPFGLGGTVTSGIVSANGRDIGSGPYDNYLQIDAPINRGNSGGPTFNLKGEVVGVNTAIVSPSGGSIGLAFAVPAGTVNSVVAALKNGGVVARGYLGVQIQPVSQDIADGLGLGEARGALIDDAQPGTPAASAGLASGDVIVKLNGRPVRDARELSREVAALKPGDKAEITYLRAGREQSASVTLAAQGGDAARPAAAERGAQRPMLGLRLTPAAGIPGKGDQGVVIVGIDPNGPAAGKGLVDGDVILEVAGKPVGRPAEVAAAVAAARQDGRKAVVLKVKGANGQRFVGLGLPRA